MTATTKFNAMFSKIIKEVSFNPDWNNGTGYMDGAVNDITGPRLQSGEMVKSCATDGRRIILIGTLLGNICVFQRYENRDDIFVTNFPRRLKETGILNRIENKLSDDNMEYLLGEDRIASDSNIGFIIEDVFVAVDKRVTNKEVSLTVEIGE